MTFDMPTAENPVVIVEGDCLDVLKGLPDGCIDAVISDPPYELGFMGKAWDRSGVAFDPATWAAVLRVLKPGGYLLAMGGSRTYHRLACAVEDAGFEVRDCLLWLYGTGFPKGAGCLKPAYEPIILARRPGPTVLPLGIDECRVGSSKRVPGSLSKVALDGYGERTGRRGQKLTDGGHDPNLGRYPANLLHDGSDEVLAAFAAFGERDSGGPSRRPSGTYARPGDGGGYQGVRTTDGALNAYADTGTAARFFYCAKAGRTERGAGNTHPTVKPLALMRWLVRLACPPGGLILDPFAGSGTTGVAAALEGRRAVLIEQDPAYAAVARRRVAAALADGPGHLTAGVAPPADLFAGAAANG